MLVLEGDFDGGGGLSDCQDITQLKQFTYEFVRRGYTKAQIEKIWGGNLMRVFKQIEDISKKTQEQVD